MDIVITPLKTFYREGLLVKDRKMLLKQYISTYFWVDVIGLISIIIPLILRQYLAANIVKILFFPKILVLNHLDEKIVNVLILRTRAKTAYLISRLIVFLILISHYIGIGFYMVSYYVYSTNYYGPNTPNICWIYNAEAYSQIILLLDWKGQYAYTMYFSLGMTTTIAYGDITPLNPLETFYIVFALVINCLVFGYILSEIMRILIEAFYAEFNMDNLKFTMENLLVANKVKPKLKQLIRAHMEQIATEEMYRDRDI